METYLKFTKLVCPNCGFTTENPKIHWVRAVSNPYYYRPAYTEVECARCHFISEVEDSAKDKK